MKKRIAVSLALVLVFLLLFVGCGARYKDDARVGSYVAYGADGKTVTYRLTLDTRGEGKMIHYPAFGPEESEEIIFTFEGEDGILIHGTEAVGGVLGRNEYTATVALEGSKYAFELRAVATGVPLAVFVQE